MIRVLPNLDITVQYSSYAVTRARCAGYLYDANTNAPKWFEGTEKSKTIYSANYNNATGRKKLAALAYENNWMSVDNTGNINFYFVGETGEINFGGSSAPLFTHIESSVLDMT